jgi:hypothetical protein
MQLLPLYWADERAFFICSFNRFLLELFLNPLCRPAKPFLNLFLFWVSYD